MTPRPSVGGLLRLVWLSPDGRLRSGWRLFVHGVLLLFIALMFLLPASLLLAASQGQEIFTRFDSPQLMLVSSAAMALATLTATGLARRVVDRRSLSSLGLSLHRSTLPQFLAGFVIAFAMMGVIFLIQLAAGWLELEGWGWEQLSSSDVLSAVLLSFAVYLLVGFQEELLFRGYQLQNLIEGTNLLVGLTASSLLFGLAHLGNPAVSWAGLLGITLAGYLLSLAWLRTRSLWLAIGLHTGWNFFEGTVFGFPVSGVGGFHLIRHRVTGPALLTGGAFGPEGGLLLLPGLLLAAYLVLLYSRHKATPSPP